MVSAIIFSMQNDLRQRLGQLFFVGIKGHKLTSKTKYFLNQIQPGGIIFFENNIKNKKQLKELINDINKILKIKPFIAIDQEGGRVQRLKNICTSIPYVCNLAKKGLKELLIHQKIISKELLQLGFNMNLAPVLDINSNPGNPVIGKRAISNDPKIVAHYGCEIIKSYIKNKIIPVAKHFPGHGDLTIDSHLDLPVLKKTYNELNDFELLPFKFAIKNKVPAIMVGHIQVPALEKNKKLPASLSKNIIEKLLKKKLNYKGLIITDELNMRGVSKNYSLEKAACEAVKAGANLILFNQNEWKTLKAFWHIKKKTKIDKKFRRKIEKSYNKIQKVKKTLLSNS